MGDRIKKQLHDESTNVKWQFSMRCEECGRLWKSTPMALANAVPPPPAEERIVICETLRRRELETAKRIARKEAQECFSICPICGRVICDACFRVCEVLDMCRTCAERLNENGEPSLEWCDGKEEEDKV